MACLVIELKRVIWEHELIQDDTDEVGRSLCDILRGLALTGDGKAQLFIIMGVRHRLFELESSLHLVTMSVCSL